MATTQAFGADGKLQTVDSSKVIVAQDRTGKKVPVIRGQYVPGTSAIPPATPTQAPAGLERIPNVSSINQYSNVTKPDATGAVYGKKLVRTPSGGIAEINPLDEWKNNTMFLESAKDIMRRSQAFNEDINTQKKYWNEITKDTTPFGGQLAPESGLGKGALSDQAMRYMSPADQASIRASRDAAASAHLTGLAEEQKYRQTRMEDNITILKDLYKEKQDALAQAKSDANEKERLALQKEANTISLMQKYGDASDLATRKLIEDALKRAGVKVPDVSLPLPYQATTSNLGAGRVTAYGSDKWKPGLDFVLDGGAGTDITLPYNFEVTKSFVNGGFGNQVQVKNLDTGETIWYSHLQNPGLQTGSYKAGTSIGKMGSTGQSTGPHIDITMPDGKGGYLSAEEVAKRIGISTGPQSQYANNKDINIDAIAEYYGMSKEDLNKQIASEGTTAAELKLLTDYALAAQKTESAATNKTIKDQAAYAQMDKLVADEQAKGTKGNVIYSQLIRQFGNQFTVGELQTAMMSAGYTSDGFGGWIEG